MTYIGVKQTKKLCSCINPVVLPGLPNHSLIRKCSTKKHRISWEFQKSLPNAKVSMVLHQLFIGAKFTISLEQTFFTRRVDGENKSKCCIKKSTYFKTFDFDLLLIQPLCLCSLCMILQILQTCCTDQCDAFIVPSVLGL